MKLILIYGPPAVGKLTVAQALADNTNFKLLHNHLFGDLIGSLFDRGTHNANILNQQVRTLIYKTAAIQNINGIVTTFVYRHDQEERERGCILGYKESIEPYGGRLFLIRLSCTIETLHQRVINPLRLGTKKIVSINTLEKELQQKDLTNQLTVPGVSTLNIDNTTLEPKAVVELIKLHCQI